MASFTLATSLRRKITAAYAIIGLLILIVSLVTIEELKLVEGKVLRSERTSELFDSVLEIRRYERNFYLYAQDADYRENAAYVEKTRSLLDRHTVDPPLGSTPRDIPRLRDGLARYGLLMKRYHDTPGQRHDLQGEVRAAGQGIVAIAQDIVTGEQQAVHSLLGTLRSILVFSIGAVVLLMVAMGRGLSMSVVKPLKRIEESVDAVSHGQSDHLALASNDREIVSITNAFNNMLRELELRRTHLLRSEKLASLGTMLSGVAHELNNPLSNIWTSCQILQDELGTIGIDDQAVLLRQIDEQAVRARNIVRALLDFARDRDFIAESVVLRQLVEQTMRFLKGEIPTAVNVVIDVADDIAVMADRQRLQQVFVNLIKNALDAVRVSGEVRIEARRVAAGDSSQEQLPFSKRCGSGRRECTDQRPRQRAGHRRRRPSSDLRSVLHHQECR